MHRIVAGDKQAFSALFERHEASVFGFCMRTFSGNRALVEEVTQETWLKVVRGASTYRLQGSFKAWLMTIARNEAISKFRREGRNTHFPEEEGDSIASDVNLEMDYLRAYESAALRAAIDALPEQPRKALMLWLTDGATYEDVSLGLGISVEAVRSLLYRTKRELKERLEKK